jgi:transposase
LLRLNRFKQVHYALDQPRRNFKTLVQHYDELTTQQARLKTKLKVRLRMQGVIVTGTRLFSAAGRKPVLAQVKPRDVRTAISQLYEVLDQSLVAQAQAKLLMLSAAQAFPEIKLFRTAPGVGPIGACRFSAYIHTPQRFSSKRKQTHSRSGSRAIDAACIRHVLDATATSEAPYGAIHISAHLAPHAK